MNMTTFFVKTEDFRIAIRSYNFPVVRHRYLIKVKRRTLNLVKTSEIKVR